MALAFCATFNIAAQPAQAQTAPAATTTAAQPDMTLRFHNLHTGEDLTLTRNKGDALPADAVWFMRDHRQGKTDPMDPRLFDLLGRLETQIEKKHPGLDVTFDVVSSYRTSATNENMRKAGGGQAKVSQHTHGTAMDIRVSGVTTRELRDIATCLKGGGVGYYAEDRFVHVDVSRVRYWPSHDYLAALPCNQTTKTAVASVPKTPQGPIG
ncbi:MAG: YcbK family protein [Alphaproteobacteria bacterium]